MAVVGSVALRLCRWAPIQYGPHATLSIFPSMLSSASVL